MNFGKKLAALRKESGLTQMELAADTPPPRILAPRLARESRRNPPALVRDLLADALVPGFSAKTISDKERGVGAEPPALEFVRLYVQRCWKYRRRDVSADRYDPTVWERHHAVLVDLIENTAPPDAAPSKAVAAENRRLRDFHPEHLGVHRAVQDTDGQRKVPSYVTRPHDRRLQTVLRQAETDTAFFILIIGGSSTGKTRTAYEALRQKHGGWNVFRPRDAGDLRAFLQQHRAHHETIVWLDEAQRYLGGAAGAAAVLDLRRLCQSRRRIVVIGTIWQEDLDRLNPQVKDDVDRIAVKVYVPEAFSGLELRRAHRVAEQDHQIAEALAGTEQHGLVVQTLACGLDLVDRYEHSSNPYGRAIVTAAMDLSRLGIGPLLDAELLREAAAGYLDPSVRAQPPADWFSTGLQWACTPVRNAVAALEKARYTPGLGTPDGYELNGYLDQHSRRSRGASAIPASVWNALLLLNVNAAERRRLGTEAHRRSLFRLAAELWRSSDLTPEAWEWETTLLVSLLQRAGHFDEAEWWLRCTAAEGGWEARHRLVDFLLAQERYEDAAAFACSVAEAGDEKAAADLHDLVSAAKSPPSEDTEVTTPPAGMYQHLGLDDPARTDEVWAMMRRELARLEEEPPSPAACLQQADLASLVAMLMEHGQGQEAVAALRAAFDQGQRHLGSLLARFLARLGHVDEAIDTVAGLTHDEDFDAAETLATLVYTHGRVDQAVALLGDQALEYVDSLDKFVAFLLGHERTEEVLEFLARAAARGHIRATQCLAVLLESGGSREQATATLQAAVRAGHDGFVPHLGRLLLESGDVLAAQQLLEEQVDRGETQAAFALALLFQRQNAASTAISVLSQEAQSGTEAGREALLWLHLSRNDMTRAEATLRTAAAHGDTEAEAALERWAATQQPPTEYVRTATIAECRIRTELSRQLESVGRVDEALEELAIASRIGRQSERIQYFTTLCTHQRTDGQIRFLRDLVGSDAQQEVIHSIAYLHQLDLCQEAADCLRALRPEPDELDLTILFHMQSIAGGPDAGLKVLERAAAAGSRWARRVYAPLNRRRQAGTYSYPTLLYSPESVTRLTKALRVHASVGDAVAQAQLAGVLEEVSRYKEAAKWRRSIADSNPASGLRELAGFLERTGDREGSFSARLAAAQAGDYIAMRQMAQICESGNNLPEASQWWRSAVECGDLTDTLRAAGPDTWTWSDGQGGGGMDSGLARWHEKRGCLDQAQWMRQRAGEQGALAELASFLQRNRSAEEADRLLAFGIEPGGQTSQPW
ncbi:hypothetical protein OHO28_51395 [Streptomyces europaeiscabiei]|uniref:tetratricopeptide repeat protein n=1 Tax=Streptomyces europaeiscabiei TaxID=146819 RepID=UPI002E19BE20